MHYRAASPCSLPVKSESDVALDRTTLSVAGAVAFVLIAYVVIAAACMVGMFNTFVKIPAVFVCRQLSQIKKVDN